MWRRLSKAPWDLMFYWAAGMAGNVFNLLYNLLLVRRLTTADFGIVGWLSAYQLAVAIPALAIQTTANQLSAEMSVKTSTKQLLQTVWQISGLLALVGGVVVWAAYPWLAVQFRLVPWDSIRLAVAVIWLVFFPLAWFRGVALGRQWYWWMGAWVIVEGVVRVLAAALANQSQGLLLAAWGIAGSMAVPLVWAAILFACHKLLWLPTEHLSYPRVRAVLGYLQRAAFWGVGMILPLSLDIMVLKHYWPEQQAGVYATLALVGKTVYSLNFSFIGLLIPVLAGRVAKGQPYHRILAGVLGLVVMISLGSGLIFYFWPQYSLNLLVGDKADLIFAYLPLYLVAMSLFSFTALGGTYLLMVKDKLFVWVLLLGVGAEILGLSLWHADLWQVTKVLLVNFGLMAGLAGVISWRKLSQNLNQ